MQYLSSIFCWCSRSRYDLVKKDDDYSANATEDFLASLPTENLKYTSEKEVTRQAKIIFTALEKLIIDSNNADQIQAALIKIAKTSVTWRKALVEETTKLNRKRNLKDEEISRLVSNLIKVKRVYVRKK